MQITPSLLYNYLQCPHRVWRDKFGDPRERQEPNEFVKLLWEKGILYEEEVIADLGDFEDIGAYPRRERLSRTLRAMEDGVDLIYHGILSADELLGEPDLLKKVSVDSKNYFAIDIKSGQGFEGASDDEDDLGKPKKHYAVQLCLYTDILKRLGFSAENKGFILDISGQEVEYIFDQKVSSREEGSFWDLYCEIKDEVSLILSGRNLNTPALGGPCKLCHWYKSCKKWIVENDDPSQIFYLGRSKRDVLLDELKIQTVDDLLDLDVKQLMARKKQEKGFLKGLGASTLEMIKRRANIFRKVKKPLILGNFELPEVEKELFLDIEADPTQDHIYLHGIWERNGTGFKSDSIDVANIAGKFISFIAEDVSLAAEKDAWQRLWNYLSSLGDFGSWAVYYYGRYEKTSYMHLAKKYPEVVSFEEIEEFFDNENVINIYDDIVARHTDWPLSSYSLKEIAVYLGFNWRDPEPSGANSIKWYNESIKDGNEDLMKRILDYNEDDCKATIVVKDYLVEALRHFTI